MKTLEVAGAKTKFSSVMEDVLLGEEFALHFDEKQVWKNTKKREIGTLEKKGSIEFSENWHISDEELCNL
ncbi:MAG: hypothetical protein FWH22_03205 [Fibromonadales bacterium]|nr:hypothetical protein [Fibromonadales bacterium]